MPTSEPATRTQAIPESLDAVRIVYPLTDAWERARVAQVAANTRRGIRRIFPLDERYNEVFADIRPDSALGAFSGRKVVGILLLRREGQDAYRLSPEKFATLYGRRRGALMLWAYRIAGWFTDRGHHYVQATWVRPPWRGLGLGQRMLARYMEEPGHDRITTLARPGRSVTMHRNIGLTPDRGGRALALRLLLGLTPMRTPAARAADGCATDKGSL